MGRYLQWGAVVTDKALVLEGDVDALAGPQVDSGVWRALLHLEQVLLHRGGAPRQGPEVAPLLHAGDHTGGGRTMYTLRFSASSHPKLHSH